VVTFFGEAPQVAGRPAATAALDRDAAGLSHGCAPEAERTDAHLVSVVWRCGTRQAAATVTLDGRPLALGDFLAGAYQGYLSSVAATQFQVEGIDHPATGDLRTWYLTPAALAVVFPDGVVSYPLSSLAPYLDDPSSL
jgi:hypothetical protein